MVPKTMVQCVQMKKHCLINQNTKIVSIVMNICIFNKNAQTNKGQNTESFWKDTPVLTACNYITT